MGFCRTNLFKRLESSGHAFLLSVERHILRNFIFLHAIENDLPIPIGTTDAGLLDSHSYDEDVEGTTGNIFEEDDDNTNENISEAKVLRTEKDFRQRAAEVYTLYASAYRRRFRWMPSHHFIKNLRKNLMSDAKTLRDLLVQFGTWQADEDTKLRALEDLLMTTHPDRKVLVFTQFADTVRYLGHELKARGVSQMAAVTGDTDNPTRLAWRFSPKSNEKEDRVASDNELRVMISTDVLSEGQNLQDCAIVVNYDLPWAIIRLIQRAGRVDRIGQQADNILCYSFLSCGWR